MKKVEKEKVVFIANPISGAKSKKHIPDIIKRELNHDKFVYEWVETQRAGHAGEIARDFLKEGFKKYVVCGGDGTMNEVGKVLLNTDGELGIIPAGSGNGLARHLGIPLNPSLAIKVVNRNRVSRIDSGTFNGHPFFCTSGVGFDAHIGKLFAESETRGFNTYVKTTITEFFNYIPGEYFITIDNVFYERKAFLISFANSSQYGNNAFISPAADIQDGFLDVCILSPFPKIKAIPIGISLFNKTADKLKYLEIIKSREIVVERSCEGPVHLDGEPYQMGRRLEIKVIPLSLNVIF